MAKKICDPARCGHCQYICEGDFICDKKEPPVMVVSDWNPTEEYMWCTAADTTATPCFPGQSAHKGGEQHE